MRSVLNAVSLLAMLAAAGCPKPGSVGPSSGPVGYIPKCPDHPLAFVVAELDTSTETYVTRTLTSIPLSGELSTIVEVHDCQRLISVNEAGGPKKLQYGPVAAIFASDRLDSPLSTYDVGRVPRASAVIYSWNTSDPKTGDYENLGIKAGWNCLYVYQHGNVVAARMVPVLRDTLCLSPPGGRAGTDLKVIVKPPPAGMGSDDIPPVARWAGDLGEGARANHIWIRCGNMSCEIGPNGFKPEAGLPPEIRQQISTLSGMTGTGRMVDIAGWGDHQLLANPGTSGKPEVGSVPGTLIPVPRLGIMDEAAFSGWQVVAYAYLPEAATTYSGKLNFDKGINVISLHYGARNDGAIPSNVTVPACKPVPMIPSEQWWAMVKSARGTTKYFCVHRWEHSVGGKPLPGTVRWRWLDDDETTWFRCPKGCCPIG